MKKYKKNVHKLTTITIYKCVHESLRLSQRNIKFPLSSQIEFTVVMRRQELLQFMV